jgi:hypothetical protein
MRADDGFWAARLVSRFTDDGIRAIVRTGRFRDPEAERFLADTIIRRRDKVVAYYFRQVNPLSDFAVMEREGRAMLAFRNLGEEARLAPVEAYTREWFRYDNASGRTAPLAAEARTAHREIPIPRDGAEYLMVRIRTLSPEPRWKGRVDVYVRNAAPPTVVGTERE